MLAPMCTRARPIRRAQCRAPEVGQPEPLPPKHPLPRPAFRDIVSALEKEGLHVDIGATPAEGVRTEMDQPIVVVGPDVGVPFDRLADQGECRSVGIGGSRRGAPRELVQYGLLDRRCNR